MKRRALLLAVLIAAAGCASGRADSDANPVIPTVTATSSTTTTTSSTAASTTTTKPIEVECPEPLQGGSGQLEPADAGPYAIGRAEVTYVDASRRTEPPPGSGAPASAARTLPVVILFPATGAPGNAIVDDADPAPGRFPLVVYSHGVASSGRERHEALARWAAAGYVVLAPTFPLSSLPWSDIRDLRSQPADVGFVTDTFRSQVQDPTHPLYDHIRRDCLALAGHSMGGATTLAASFDPCCDGLAPDAVIDIAGVAVNFTPDIAWSDSPAKPTLIVHGALDSTVPVSHSREVFAGLPGARWLVEYPGGQHSSMFEPPEVEVLTASVVAFLDAQLKGAPSALDSLPAVVEASAIATVATAGR
ncbi:MAG: hypothetical protein V9E94_16145 [Microthrixaceae bacterium]